MANGKSPAFQFYPRDWITGTLAMSCAERGAYINLLCACWDDGSLPTDNEALRRISGAEMPEWEAIKGAPLAHFTIKDGRYINKRLEEEHAKQRAWSKKSRVGGLASVVSRRLDDGSNQTSTNDQPQGQPNINASSSSSSSSSSSPPSSLASLASAKTTPSAHAAVDDGFEAFWKSYPKKVGKGDAAKVWHTLRPSVNLQATIAAAVTAQRSCRQWLKDGGQYIPNPATWLRQKRWDDRPDPEDSQPDDHIAKMIENMKAKEEWLASHR